jgi:hypothetical protein
MFRNKLINGGFDVWQRGTSQTTSGYGSDDRWNNVHSGSTKTASRQTFTLGQTDVPGNPTYFARTVVASVAGVNNIVIKQHRIENVSTLAGQTATLSFWAKADASKNIAVEFQQDFGTGGSPSAAVNTIGVNTCALSTTWRYFTVTVNIPSISGKVLGSDNNSNLQLNFWFDAGSSFNSRTNSLGQQSGTFDIANVQLEAGAQATPFEQRPIGTELNLCQRYCFVMKSDTVFAPQAMGFASSAAVANLFFQMPVPMRKPPANVTPTGSFQVSDATNASAVSSFSFPATQASPVAVVGTANTSGLTTFRPMRLETANNF